MVNKGYALSRHELIRTLTAYSGITTDDGNIGGTTLRDRNLIGRNDFITEKTILLMSGDAQDEDKGAAGFAPLTGIITLQSAVSAQIKAGTIFKVLNISSIEIDVATINTKLGTNVDLPGTTTVFAWLAKLFASGGATFDLVNALLTLTETGGTITATGLGTEDNVYINDAPAGVFKPLLVTIDLSDLAGGEVATVRTYYRIKSGGTARLKGAPVIFNGVQAEPMKDVTLQPNRFGVVVTIEATVGTVIDWEVHYEV